MDLNKLEKQQNICFVLPTYNEERTIESIIEQIKAEEKKQNTYKFSILVVDDNSTDQTQAVVRKVIDSSENIYLITGQKKGLGDAYKRGFLFALDTLEEPGLAAIVVPEEDYVQPPVPAVQRLAQGHIATSAPKCICFPLMYLSFMAERKIFLQNRKYPKTPICQDNFSVFIG